MLCGFRVAHVFDISQTEGDPLPDITPELLTGDAPAALWDALAAQVAAHGYALSREACGQANGLTDPAARTARVRPDVADAQAVTTLAHELAHIECGHTAEGYDYRGCRGRAEAEAGRGPRTGGRRPGRGSGGSAAGVGGVQQGGAQSAGRLRGERDMVQTLPRHRRPCPGARRRRRA